MTERPLLYASMSLGDHFFWNGNSAGDGRRVEFSKYQRDPDSYPGVTLIPAGTTIACVKVQYHRSIEYSALEMLGEMLDGPMAGSRFHLTDLAQVPVDREISCRGITVPYYKPNPAIIRIKESSNNEWLDKQR